MRLLEAMGKEVLLAAPTGRAAQRIHEVIERGGENPPSHAGVERRGISEKRSIALEGRLPDRR